MPSSETQCILILSAHFSAHAAPRGVPAARPQKNALQQNGFQRNGFNQNGLMQNGFMQNGVGQNQMQMMKLLLQEEAMMMAQQHAMLQRMGLSNSMNHGQQRSPCNICR